MICPTCKGKGYKFDKLMLMTGPFWLLTYLLEYDDPKNPKNVSTKRCWQCKGKGKV